MNDSPDIPTMLTIREWHDVLLTQRWLRADSNYTALVWRGLIGPTAVVFLRLMGQLTTDGRVVEIALQELATTIGVSPPLAQRGIDRLARFGFIRRRGNTPSVRHFVGMVTEGRNRKLSPLAQRVDRTYRRRAGTGRSLSENKEVRTELRFALRTDRCLGLLPRQQLEGTRCPHWRSRSS